MHKIWLLFLAIVLVCCSAKDYEQFAKKGIVVSQTSCSGGVEPVFIIKLNETDSILTATLPKQFQQPNLKIQFKTREKSSILFCTTDKIYPENFDVYDVVLLPVI